MQDDPTARDSDDRYAQPNPFLITAKHKWNNNRTDGVVIGPLTEPWTMHVAVADTNGNGVVINGIDQWQAIGDDGGGGGPVAVPLVVQPDRRVRLRLGAPVSGILNRVFVTSANDPVPGNNYASVATTVEGN